MKYFDKERLIAAKEELTKSVIDSEQKINYEAIDIAENFDETNKAFKRVFMDFTLNLIFNKF